jgi:hypothetical protein
VTNRGAFDGVFRARKICHFFEVYFLRRRKDTPGAKAPGHGESERPKAEALGYLETKVLVSGSKSLWVPGSLGRCFGFGIEDDDEQGSIRAMGRDGRQ